jgi:hypothetical protein
MFEGDPLAVTAQLEEHWQVVRDRTAPYGDLISPFMKTLGRADLVIVVLSVKYLQSPYCMTELQGLQLGGITDYRKLVTLRTVADTRVTSLIEFSDRRANVQALLQRMMRP